MTELSLREQIVFLADVWCETTGRSRSRLSTLLFSSGRRLDSIVCGSDLTTGSFERAKAWLSGHWPDGLAWPEGIDRPTLMDQHDASG